MANFIKNYFNGKPGQRDYTEADLPGNRIELFRQVLGVRKGPMVGLNLLYLLIWIPAILWTFINLVQFTSGDLELAEYAQTLMFTWLLLLFPMIAITGPFNAGLSSVMCRWARDEHSFPYSDFFAAIRENWKQALLFSALDGLVPLLLFLCVRYYAGMAQSSRLFLAPLAVSVIAAVIWSLAAPIVPALIVSYRQSFGGILRNALLMTLAELPRAVAMRLITLIVPVLTFAGLLLFPGAFSWIAGVASLLYTVILLALNRLIWASFANFLGEKYLNPKIEGARTGIGLRPKDAQ